MVDSASMRVRDLSVTVRVQDSYLQDLHFNRGMTLKDGGASTVQMSSIGLASSYFEGDGYYSLTFVGFSLAICMPVRVYLQDMNFSLG